MDFIIDRYLNPFVKFSLFMLQLLLVLSFILAGIGIFWGVMGNGFDPVNWALKTLLPASFWGVIYFALRMLQARRSEKTE